ncbi:hypothetical protein PV10_04584 [Exophiala mesophila]|uniref:P-loop containing nucleoside triphosphate hydrolase protein n=1 Tax=Exophiala mesophila TaxID=212818 RepID=A0A0D2A2U2_EXOME|nr:uncharacterized protein PV10_04584 [Exophiala mesophila]KIV93368.1 hypothetical protein PV10_04584 [Exophiala mesophila]
MAPKKGTGSKNAQSKKPNNTVPDSDHIVFSNRQDDKRKKDQKESEGPPRPDTKKIIGGASWTGKLPVNLLSEHCQRQKWNKPDYHSKQVPSGGGDGEKLFRAWVTLSKSDPKTREITRLPPFQLPPENASLADQATALEARHFAATYALYRVSSMKNISMILPPKYRDLWKGEFQRLKEDDVKQDRGWKYDADPFAADVKRQEIKAAMEKRRQEQAAQPPKVEALTLVQPGGESRTPTKTWDYVPKLELGEAIRTRIEAAIRSRSLWNPNAMQMSASEASLVLADLIKSGFKPAHVEEAISYCGSRREVLEWLLIHVPEDSLPEWSFPPGYTAGVSLVSSDLATDGKIKRMAQAGYSSQLCVQALRDNKGDEVLALEALQSRLVPPPHSENQPGGSREEDVWSEEMTTLKAILDDRLTLHSPNHCSITSEENSSISAIYHFRRPSHGYPFSHAPVFSLEAPKLPGYVRLSVLKQCVQYAQKDLLGEQMIFSLLEWLEISTADIIHNPGRLAALEINSSSLSVQTSSSPTSTEINQQRSRTSNSTRNGGGSYGRDIRTNAAILQDWRTRQETNAQIKMNTSRHKLPAWAKQDSIVDIISHHQVALITGETGSGKSTQAIQYVLDNAIQSMKGSSTNLLCTQPRRVAALSLSERVSAERCGVEGHEVGYSIRGASKVSRTTKITFMTTGVLLRRLQGAKTVQAALADVSHVFVDEVHERSLDTDFLLALLRDALPALPTLKVVLMSATLDADVFASYFGGDAVGRVHIEGRTFPVQDLYLDDIVRLTQMPGPAGGLPTDQDSPDDVSIGRAIQALGSGVNYDLITRLVNHISSDLGPSSGGILIFLPGVLEIDRCVRALGKLSGIHALPLHASLTPAEQRLVFRSPPSGMRKVVAATNVAETSITIEDIVAVIDTGRVKETSYDAVSNIVRLQEVWASKAACKQRRGRAGRVRAGKCYKLFTRNVEAAMAAAPAPEMHRTPLEQLCLSVKATGADRDVAEFLARTISPPDRGAVAMALKTLERVGALENNQLTGLGTYMSMIPADLRCAKLIIYGVLFECVETCLTIAAILSTKNPFVSPQDKREEAKEARLSFPTVDGDLLLASTAFDQWKQQSSVLRHRDLQTWCSARFLSLQTLRDIDSTRRQLLDSLIEAGLLSSGYSTDATMHNRHNSSTMLLRAVIAGSLNPQIARIQMPDKKYIASMSGAKELDPEAKTIKYFTEDNGRVFVHPSSVLFDAQSFSGAATFVSYFTKMATSKTFMRDLTPLNAYALLLFGGKIEVDTSGLGVVVDGWFKLKGWARIGVLASRLRVLLDDELKTRIDASGTPEDEGTVFDIVRHLVELNGQDK